MRRSPLAAVTAMALIPSLSVAWWPGGADAVPPAPYAPGAYWVPAAPTPPAPGWTGPAPSDLAAPRVRLDIARRILDDGYLVDVRVEGLDPEQILVRPVGRALVIGYSRARRVDRRDTLPGIDGYRTSYSVSRGIASRRLALPPDADPSRLSREVRDGHLLIRVPRIQAGPGGWPPVPPAY